MVFFLRFLKVLQGSTRKTQRSSSSFWCRIPGARKRPFKGNTPPRRVKTAVVGLSFSKGAPAELRSNCTRGGGTPYESPIPALIFASAWNKEKTKAPRERCSKGRKGGGSEEYPGFILLEPAAQQSLLRTSGQAEDAAWPEERRGGEDIPTRGVYRGGRSAGISNDPLVYQAGLIYRAGTFLWNELRLPAGRGVQRCGSRANLHKGRSQVSPIQQGGYSNNSSRDSGAGIPSRIIIGQGGVTSLRQLLLASSSRGSQ